jgi:hypothetical protein
MHGEWSYNFTIPDLGTSWRRSEVYRTKFVEISWTHILWSVIIASFAVFEIIIIIIIIIILSRIGYVTRLVSSLCQEFSGYLLCYLYTLIHFTIIPLVLCVPLSWLTSSVGEPTQLSLAVVGSRLSSTATIPRLSFECNPLLYMWPLLRNEPFVMTVETPVRITIELLLLPMQRSSAFPWKYLF